MVNITLSLDNFSSPERQKHQICTERGGEKQTVSGLKCHINITFPSYLWFTGTPPFLAMSNWKISTTNCSSQQTLTWYLYVPYFPFIIHSGKMVLHLTRSPKLHIRGLMVIPLSATTFSRHPKQLDDGTLKVPILDSSTMQWVKGVAFFMYSRRVQTHRRHTTRVWHTWSLSYLHGMVCCW